MFTATSAATGDTACKAWIPPLDATQPEFIATVLGPEPQATVSHTEPCHFFHQTLRMKSKCCSRSWGRCTQRFPGVPEKSKSSSSREPTSARSRQCWGPSGWVCNIPPTQTPTRPCLHGVQLPFSFYLIAVQCTQCCVMWNEGLPSSPPTHHRIQALSAT